MRHSQTRLCRDARAEASKVGSMRSGLLGLILPGEQPAWRPPQCSASPGNSNALFSVALARPFPGESVAPLPPSNKGHPAWADFYLQPHCPPRPWSLTQGQLCHEAQWGQCPGPTMLSGAHENVLISSKLRRKNKYELSDQSTCYNIEY